MKKSFLVYGKFQSYIKKLDALKKDMHLSIYEKVIEIFEQFYNELSIIFRYHEERIVELNNEVDRKNKYIELLEEIKKEFDKYFEEIGKEEED